MDIATADFWLALGSIVLTNVVLSGDNAVVIALAARGLPPVQQRRAIVWGSAAAIVLRIVLTVAAVRLLQLPWLKTVGAAALFWIGVQLLLDEDGGAAHDRPAASGIGAAVRTILVADLVMSLDNVLAVAAAAKDSLLLLVVGLAVSVPLIVFGSTLLLKVMERLPFLVTLGGALLGYLSGDMLFTDPAWTRWWPGAAAWAHAAGAAAAVGVVGVGMAVRRTRPHA